MGTICRNTGVVWSGGAGISLELAGGRAAHAGAFVLFFFRDPEKTIPSDPDLIISPATDASWKLSRKRAARPWPQNQHLSLHFRCARKPRAGGGPNRGHGVSQGALLRAMRGARRRKTNKMLSTFPPSAGRLFSSRSPAGSRGAYCVEDGGGPRDSGRASRYDTFGSRVDIWLPNRVEILVRPGQHVAGGSSILARWR